MRNDPTPLRLAVLAVLDKWEYYDWSVQGFGVLRCYIRHPWEQQSCGRLHLWDSALRYPRVSMVHNHSWDLKSTIVAGRLVNERYKEVPSYIGHSFLRQRLLTGYQSQMVGSAPEPVWLLNQPRETYRPGDVYVQRAAEIHQTLADDGTVTLMARKEDVGPGYADVFWPTGHEYGTAKPRPALGDEISHAVSLALAQLREVA